MIIANKEKLDQKIQAMAAGRAGNLHILADFDRTLTTASVNGSPMPSLMSILRNGNYLSPDYAKIAQAFFDKYHLIEVDQNIALEEKKRAMKEWWTVHFQLLIDSGFRRNDLKKIAASGKIQLRDGVKFFYFAVRPRRSFGDYVIKRRGNRGYQRFFKNDGPVF